MIGCSKNQNKICSFWLALSILATVFFPAAAFSEETPETVEKPAESLPENNSQGDQAEQQPEAPEDFKPSEEISEDFPVPLPSDI